MSEPGLNRAVERAGTSPLVQAWLKFAQLFLGFCATGLLAWTLSEVVGMRNDLIAVQVTVFSEHHKRIADNEQEIRANREELALRTRDRFTAGHAMALENRFMAELARLRAEILALSKEVRAND